MANTFNVSDLDAIVRNYLKTNISEKYPDIDASDNSVFDDLYIKPTIENMSPLLESVNINDIIMSLSNADVIDDAVLEDIGLNNYGLERNMGSKASATLTLNLAAATSDNVVIKEGTKFYTSDGLCFETIETIVFTPEEIQAAYNSATVLYTVYFTVVSEDVGSEYNVGANQIVVFPDDGSLPPATESVTNAMPATGGTDIEGKQEYADRIRTWYITRFPDTKSGYRSDILKLLPNLIDVVVVGYQDERMTRDEQTIVYNQNTYPQLIHYELMYDSGDDCDQVTGGWETYKTSGETIVVDDEEGLTMYAEGDTPSLAMVGTSQPISCGNYKYFGFIFEKTLYNSDNGEGGISVGTCENKTEFLQKVTFPKPTFGQRIYIGNATDLNGKMTAVEVASIQGVPAKAILRGAVIVQEDDWGTLCEKALFIPPVSLSALLNDRELLNMIFASDDAVMYMTAQCTGEFMLMALDSSEFMGALKVSRYRDIVYANPHWSKFLSFTELNEYDQEVHYTMLYDNGEDNTAVTGGFVISKQNGTENIQVKDMRVDVNSYAASDSVDGAISYSTRNPFNLAGYAALMSRIKYISIKEGSCCGAAIADAGDPLSPSATSSDSPVLGYKTFVLDINGYDDEEVCEFYAKSVKASLHNLAIFEQDEWMLLASEARIQIETIDELLEHSAQLLSNENAVKFMVAKCTGEFMAYAISNQNFLNALDSSPFKLMIQSNEHWGKFLTMIA